MCLLGVLALFAELMGMVVRGIYLTLFRQGGLEIVGRQYMLLRPSYLIYKIITLIDAPVLGGGREGKLRVSISLKKE